MLPALILAATAATALSVVRIIEKKMAIFSYLCKKKTLLVFGTVISDAAMVDRVIGMDVQEAAAARDRVPRRDRGMGERPRRREIEGIGGRLWYELGH